MVTMADRIQKPEGLSSKLQPVLLEIEHKSNYNIFRLNKPNLSPYYMYEKEVLIISREKNEDKKEDGASDQNSMGEYFGSYQLVSLEPVKYSMQYMNYNFNLFHKNIMLNFVPENLKYEFEPITSLNHLYLQSDVLVRIVTLKIEDEIDNRDGSDDFD